MANAAMPTQITQQDVDSLIEQLHMLREQIIEARAAIVPLQENLARVHEEYQEYVGSLRRNEMRLQAEIRILTDRLEDEEIDESDREQNDQLQTGNEKQDNSRQVSDVSSMDDPEAENKDRLLEHLVHVLDPMTNEEDGELLGMLQGLYRDATTRLIDMLEHVPWGAVWTNRSRQESVNEQYQRLKIWEEALSQQLTYLHNETDRLYKNDRRYGLWQQYQKGNESWKQFLQQSLEKQKERNEDLQAELDDLQALWSQRVSET
jgi:predicted RNase H-like nuclease (RuvC/YqgF family)